MTHANQGPNSVKISHSQVYTQTAIVNSMGLHWK